MHPVSVFIGRTPRTRQGAGRCFVTGWQTVATAPSEGGTKRREGQRTTPLVNLLAKLLSALRAWAEASFAGALHQPCSSVHSVIPVTYGSFEASSGTAQKRSTPPIPPQRSTIRSCFLHSGETDSLSPKEPKAENFLPFCSLIPKVPFSLKRGSFLFLWRRLCGYNQLSTGGESNEEILLSTFHFHISHCFCTRKNTSVILRFCP